MKRLSKSRYTAFCQCPKNLWLKVYKPEEAAIDGGMEARFAQGNEVGDLAMGLFGDFKEVTAHQEDGSMDLQKMIDLTKQYMDKGVENICEASFSCEGGYCAVDILRKDGEGWAIYEVKSTGFPEFNGQEAKAGEVCTRYCLPEVGVGAMWRQCHGHISGLPQQRLREAWRT